MSVNGLDVVLEGSILKRMISDDSPFEPERNDINDVNVKRNEKTSGSFRPINTCAP